jgi:F-type H+-transporting ATPase subunit delta
MIKLSRRALAQWGAEQLLADKGARQIARHLVASLEESNRLSEIDFLLEDIAWELERRQALAIGKVTSAYPLTAKLETELKNYLKKSTGAQQVVLENNLDKSVIGGVRLETAGQVWDNTIKRKLSELKGSF